MTFERHILAARVLVPTEDTEIRNEASGLTRRGQDFLDLIRKALSSSDQVLVESAEMQVLPDEMHKGSRTRRIEYADGEWLELHLDVGYGHVTSSLSQGLGDLAEVMYPSMTTAEAAVPNDADVNEFLSTEDAILPPTVFDVAFDRFIFTAMVASVHEVLLEHTLADELILADKNYLTRLHDLMLRVRKYAP